MSYRKGTIHKLKDYVLMIKEMIPRLCCSRGCKQLNLRRFIHGVGSADVLTCEQGDFSTSRLHGPARYLIHSFLVNEVTYFPLPNFIKL